MYDFSNIILNLSERFILFRMRFRKRVSQNFIGNHLRYLLDIGFVQRNYGSEKNSIGETTTDGTFSLTEKYNRYLIYKRNKIFFAVCSSLVTANHHFHRYFSSNSITIAKIRTAIAVLNLRSLLYRYSKNFSSSSVIPKYFLKSSLSLFCIFSPRFCCLRDYCTPSKDFCQYVFVVLTTFCCLDGFFSLTTSSYDAIVDAESEVKTR